MATSQEIEAAAEAIRITMRNMYGVESLDLDDRYQVSRTVLRAVETVRREECKHPMKRGSATVTSDGKSWGAWYCPDCGASGTWG
jgi:hypothetical protein